MTSFPGKTRLSAIGLILLATMAWLLPQWSDASNVIRSFDQRYQLTGRADAVVIGNQLLNCSTAASGCNTARNGSGNNNDFTMGQVDIDGQAGTFNSSMAPLSIPAGSTVQRAYLYWGADTSAGTNGSAAPTAASRNQVRFSAAGGAYVTVTAGTVDVTGTRYSAIADVTSLVATAGSGNYMTANVQAGTGADRYAGWGLVVIYSNPTLPLRSLTLFDGSLNINTSAPSSITTTVSGFRTPATGAVDARIGLIAFEGDNNFTGDQFRVNGTNISDALNPTSNIFNSTNSRLGVAQTGRNPQQSNMLGFDVDYIPVAAGVIANNDTSASLTFTTTSETYYPIALLFQTNVYEPEIVTNFSKAATDLNGGQFRPGDVLEYTIALSNTGDDAADQTVISDPLPMGLTYVPGSIEVVTGANAGAKTDAAGDDQAEYNAGTRTVTVRVGTGANASTGGRIAPVPQASSSTSVRFRAQIDLVQPNGAALANIAGITYVGATSGTSSSGNTPPSNVTVSRDADLAITKAGPASVVAGAPIQYTLTVSSLGPDAADGATVTDNVPAGITAVSITCAASGGATCPVTTGLATLSAVALPAMPSGGQVVFTINGTAPMAATTLSNSASVAAPSGTIDPTPGNNSAGPVATTVDAGLDLAVTGSLVTAGTIRTGDAVAYQFTVTNNGPVVAPNAPFSLPAPAGLAGVAWTCAPVARCGTASGTGNLGLSLNLAVGESVTISLGGTAPATTPATLGDAVGTVTAPAGLGDSNPANNSATVAAIVVQPREISAGADSGTVVNGAVGGTAVANVLANDQFNGGPATLAVVTLSQVSTTHPGVTLDPATGAITVAPGTPTGSYTVVYQICETANPGNCTTASVTVQITNTPPVVQPDVATVVQSSTGNVVNVLANDTDAEDGAPVVTPATGTTANGGSFTCTAAGCSYTPAVGFTGTDSFTYEACDTAGECRTATVSLTVQARTLAITAASVCLADAAYLDYAVSGGNFDATGLDATIEWLDGLGNVVVTQSNQPLSGQLLWPGMVLTAGVPTDWPGWILVDGVWLQAADGFEGLRPDATVRITVNPTDEVAVAYPPATPGCAAAPPANAVPLATDDSDATVGVTPVTTNVLANDSDPENGPLVVTLTGAPASGSAVVNADGSITFTAAPGFAGTVTYTYTITDGAGLTATATVSIDVTLLALAAGDDTGTVANGAAGGTAVANVLANDTLDGAPATLANVTLVQVATTNPNVSLDPATGAVNVAPGTPAGTYVVSYEICELANPGNCQQAAVSVTVGAAVIDALDDDLSGLPVNGASGGSTAPVLGNDLLGGNAAAVGVGGNVTLVPGAAPTPAAGSLTMNADGTITIAPGTSAGVYAYSYTICEVLNPTNCDTTTATVVVDAAVIDAVDDTGTTANGASGGPAVANVLANDTLNGAPATLATVSLAQLATTQPNVTLDPATGAVNVAPGTPAGTYVVTYEACERLNPANCDVAQATVTVGAAAIVANADTGAVANGAAGGNAVANVLVNDLLNGAPATLATVVVTQTATTNPNVTLNPATGAVNVAVGTPAGTYTVTYQICEQLNPTNCDTATVTVTVGAAVIDAVDDDLTGAPLNGAAGGTTASVLGNDTLGGAAATVGVGGNVTLTPGAAPTPAAGSITMNANGTITVAPGTTAGTYTYAYTICEVLNPTNCDTASVLVEVNAPQLTMSKTASAASFTVGVPASYTLQVSNTGTATTTASATVTDTIPTGLAIGTLPAGCTAASQTVTCTIPAGLSVGSSTAYVVPVTPTAAAGASVTNTATVSGGGDPTCPAAARCTSMAGPTPVDAIVIVAVDDSGTVASGAAGGTAVASVLVNDTLGGNPATLATVTLSQVSTTNPNVTLDAATGAVNVAVGTPAGTYTVTYQICEQLNPTNCDTASVTVTVGAAVIDAVDDDLTGAPLNGAAGGTTASVLGNDTLAGATATVGVGGNVTLTPGAAPTPAAGAITMNANGTITIAPGTTAGVYTYDYTVCEVLNPTNCDTATVTLVVDAAVIDAVDDTGVVANGASGGTAVANVLANDTLDGAPATLASVTLSQLATTNPNVTLDPATGSVNVAPGTPAGTYTVTYEVCEILNPSNCDVAQVTVTVGAAPIDAVDDIGTVANGAAGGAAVANILVNDTLNGAPATLANVVVTQTATTNPNVTLDPATGAVNLAVGTPAGTYTVTYQICEQLNPTNCDSATVTVTVGAAVIDAVDDDLTGSPLNGAAGGTTASVLGNDTLGGAAATVGVGGNVTLVPGAAPTPAAGSLTMNADGTITIAPGTSAGVYTYSYTICEVLNPTNCDTATATIAVEAAVIDAVDDTGAVANGASGGTAVANVLVNDTLNGAPATLATVSLVQLATTQPNVTLDVATGAVNVAPGAPAGTYVVTYEICELLNPTNCDVAQATVTVGAAAIVANADSGTVANGATGGTAVPNVLVNDTLNGAPATLANVTISQVATTNPNVTLDPATGEVNVAPGTPAGTYTVTYQICEQLNPTNCSTTTVTVTVGAAVIDAVDDDLSSLPVNGSSGGTLPSVLGNDTLDGAPATVGAGGNVTLVPGAAPTPAAGSLTMNADGTITVAPGTTAGVYTYSYTVCEVLNPTNCDTATATIVVDAAVIDAADDTGTVANGASGGTAVAIVLVNDTLNGAPATLATVSLVQLATTNPAVTLDPATGAVNVAPGTPAGSFVVTYEICELLNPTNCDTATVTVTVGAAAIDAVDDTGAVANGALGGTAVANVLVNDTLNGVPATLATISLTQVSTTNPNVTLDVATGAVNVAPGTPAGTYTVTYQICEQLNPTNCDTATATVTVGAAVIDAIDDTGSLSSTAGGVAVANVLANDTLDGSAATLAHVSLVQVSTTHPNVTLDPATGAVNVAAGTPAGTYLVTYQICELLNPTNCDTAIATVTVVAPAVAAADDAGSTTQNTAVGIAVLGNDSFGGAAAGTADVTVEIIGLPANGSVVVNADGSLTYTPLANYSGPDQLRYRICGVVNPGVCAEAVVDIVVAPNTVTAPDDSRVTAQATPVSVPLLAMADTGGGAPLDPASLQIVGAPANGTVVVNADGSATYTPDTLFFGTDSFQYRICDQSVPTPVCAVGTITITVEMAAPQLRIRKDTPASTVRLGDFVRYRVTVENTGISPAGNVTLLDLPPAGFTYVEGSLVVDDADGVHGLASTQPLRITGVDIPVGGTATVGYLLRVGAGTGPGLHTNTVSATDSLGVTVSNVARADVVVEGDALLEESLVLGTVFLDLDGDGRQQPGEPGLAGVRLATVEGLVVETDVHGRFHLVGLDGGHALRGRNAIVKVDVATLPPGSRFTTPNPLVRRITPGIPVRFDFGVQLPGAGSDTSPEMR